MSLQTRQVLCILMRMSIISGTLHFTTALLHKQQTPGGLQAEGEYLEVCWVFDVGEANVGSCYLKL